MNEWTWSARPCSRSKSTVQCSSSSSPPIHVMQRQQSVPALNGDLAAQTVLSAPPLTSGATPLLVTGLTTVLKRGRYGSSAKQANASGQINDDNADTISCTPVPAGAAAVAAAEAKGFLELGRVHTSLPAHRTRTRQAIPLAKESTIARYQRLLQEDREEHRVTLDKVWQRLEQAEARAEQEHARRVAAEQCCLSVQLRCLISEEAAARVAVANEDLSQRLEWALMHKELYPQTLLPRTTEVKPHKRRTNSSRAATPLVTVPSSLSSSISPEMLSVAQVPVAPKRLPHQLRRAKTAGGGRGKARQDSSPSPNVPPSMTNGAEVSRPSTGHVRDSELLRALQAAERRVAFLEATAHCQRTLPANGDCCDDSWARSDATAHAQEVLLTESLHGYNPLMPNLIVLSDDNGIADYQAALVPSSSEPVGV